MIKYLDNKESSLVPKMKSRREQKQPNIVIVKKEDSLYKISKRIYGDGAEYMKIYKANIDIIGNNPNDIELGQKLIIPK